MATATNDTLRMYMLFPQIKETTHDLDARKAMYRVLREAIKQRRLLGMRTDNIEEMLHYHTEFIFAPELVHHFYRVLALAEEARYRGELVENNPDAMAVDEKSSSSSGFSINFTIPAVVLDKLNNLSITIDKR